MIGYRTTGISDIHEHIFQAECILSTFLDCTARQCWSLGQFRLVIYNQFNFYRFCGNMYFLVSSVFFSVFSLVTI